MVKKLVHIKGLPIDLERHLAADEGEAPAQFQQQIAQMLQLLA